MIKKCINCSYFLSCKEAEENKVECDKFEKRKGEIRNDNSKSR